MAVPQRRISKTRKRMRRTHFKLQAAGLVTCPKCGYYDGKVVVLNGKVVKEAPKAEAKKPAKKASKKAEK